MDEQERFDAIFRLHRWSLLRFFLRRTGDRTLSEDLCATVFYEAWRRRDDIDLASREPLPWLYGVAANVLRNQRRSRRRHEAALHRMGAPRPERDVADDIIERLDATREATRLIESLPRLEREVVDLCLAGDMTYTAAANRLGLPIGTVRSRLARARARAAALDPDAAASAVGQPPPPHARRHDPGAVAPKEGRVA
jgi:RNA polymerase sigma-70 factor (ECF subfamily)